jgi:hypothetical protein
MIFDNVLIVGESNSVMRDGWVSGFSESLDGVQLHNYSIGSTGIFNSIRVLTDANLFPKLTETIDLIILDSFIQDSIFFRNEDLLYEKILNSVFKIWKENYSCPIVYLYFGNIDDPQLKLKDILFH